MRFEFDGKSYFLEFQRDYKDITIQRKGSKITSKSQHPYTTARLLVDNGKGNKPTLFAEATVGCNPVDKFRLEDGRLAALKKLTEPFSAERKRAVWKAYTDRKRSKKG